MKRAWWFVLFAAALLASSDRITLLGQATSPGQSPLVQARLAQPQQSAIEEARQSPQSVARREKSVRYNGGGCDITLAIPNHECFFEQTWPRSLLPIPFQESTIVVTGRVSKIEAFLSEDRTHIYTEITVETEVIFKSFSKLGSVIIDQIGGTFKTSAGGMFTTEPTSTF
jgi:hypothetical protein